MDLEVKVMNFYPLQGERDDRNEYVKGSLHVLVKIGEIELNIRGALVCKRGKNWFFQMPSRVGFDHITGKSVKYPILSFGLDNPLNKALLDAIYEKGPVAVEAFLISHPVIDAFEQPAATPNANAAPQTAQKAAGSNEAAPDKQRARDKPKIFRDPPTRKIKSR
jgi:hypothetical protein